MWVEPLAQAACSYVEHIYFKMYTFITYAQKNVWLNQQNFGWFNHNI